VIIKENKSIFSVLPPCCPYLPTRCHHDDVLFDVC
jgi:hypothetical protein